MRLSNISVKVLIILSTNTGCHLDGMCLCLCFRGMCMKESAVLVSSLSICYDNCFVFGGVLPLFKCTQWPKGEGASVFVLFRDDCKKHLESLSMNIIGVAYSWFLRWVTQASLIDIHTFYRLPRSYTFRVLVSSSQHMCWRRFTSSSFYSWINFVLHMLMCCF